MMEFFCAVLRLPDFGMVPLTTELLIETLALKICVYVRSSPGPWELPVPWQPEFKAHAAWIIGFTSAANLLLVTPEHVVLPPPLPPPSLLLLQEAINIITAKPDKRIDFFINGIVVFYQTYRLLIKLPSGKFFLNENLLKIKRGCLKSNLNR
jgi:hypothetical protein